MNSLQSIDKRIEAVIAQIANVERLIPGVKIIYDLRTGTVIYMSPEGLRELNTSLEELRELGSEYNRRFFNIEQSAEYVPQLIAMLNSEPDKAFTFFQQASAPGKEWKWYLSAIHVLMKDDEGAPLLSLTIAQQVDPVTHLTPKVARMLEEHAFIKEHRHLFEALGEREKMVLQLLANGATNIEVATEMSISVATVETHRKNIRRKLQVSTNAELTRYALAFDLV